MLAACGGGGGGGGSDPITSATFQADSEVHTVSDTSCFNAAPFDDFEWFTFTHQSGTVNRDQHSYWTVSHPNGGYQLHVNTGSLNGDMRSVNSEAINSWTASLLAHRISQTAYTITLVEDNLNTSPVTAFQSNNQSPNDPAASGDTVYYQVTAGGMQQKTDIDFYLPNIPDRNSKYNVALHELGHAMMLAHNGHASSVMVPETGSQGCFNEARRDQPAAADYRPLENYYDPVLTENYGSGDGTVCYGSRCYQSSMRAMLAASAARPRIKSRSEGWYHPHDYFGAKHLTPESLFLSSSLVGQGVVIRDLTSFNEGFNKIIVRQVKLSQIYRHDITAASGTPSGENIQVMDVVHRSGESYRDDTALDTRLTPIMFLRPADAYWKTKFHSSKLYQFTAPFVSKWNVDANTRKIKVAGFSPSVISKEIDGSDGTILYRRALSRYGPRAVSSESNLVGAMLAARGVTSVLAVARYQADLHTRPLDVLRANVQYDAAHARIVP